MHKEIETIYKQYVNTPAEEYKCKSISGSINVNTTDLPFLKIALYKRHTNE